MLVKFSLLLAVCLVVKVDSSQEVMKQMSINFAKPLEACKQEMTFPEEVIKDFQNYWREGYELKNRLTGCAIICIARKLELLDPTFNLHHGKATEFAKTHGADDAMAKQIVDLIHNCNQSVPPVPDDACQTTVNVAMCFKGEIHKLNWAPDADLIIGELLAEV